MDFTFPPKASCDKRMRSLCDFTSSSTRTATLFCTPADVDMCTVAIPLRSPCPSIPADIRRICPPEPGAIVSTRLLRHNQTLGNSRCTRSNSSLVIWLALGGLSGKHHYKAFAASSFHALVGQRWNSLWNAIAAHLGDHGEPSFLTFVAAILASSRYLDFIRSS